MSLLRFPLPSSLLFLLAFGLFTPLFAQSKDDSVSAKNWMEQHQEKLCQKKLKDLVLPGTHNSGSSHLQGRRERPRGDALPPDTNSLKRSLALAESVYRGWSQCQKRSVEEQLSDGIRAFDLRLARAKNGKIFCCHGLYGEAFSDILKAVQVFSKRHPKEIILIDLAKFYSWGKDEKGRDLPRPSFSDAEHKALRAQILKALGSSLIPPKLPGPNGPAAWTASLETLWKSGRSIIVHDRHKNAQSPFWSGSIESSWANTWKPETMRKRLTRTLSKRRGKRFFKMNGEATPDQELILKSFDPFGSFPKDLREMARQTNPIFLRWIQRDWASKRINIVQVDHYDQSELLPLCLFLNGLRSKGLSEKTPKSHWGRWESGRSRLRRLWKRRR